ncbi:MerR family transcriptional regulator [Paenibacillus lutimineralis]|uniref:MerR family transcriptional regulator n=1 Tax=Paenibacillus lutimineralis TaxID=2707005 RepID=UPI0013A5F9C8|nr:MerR family transcriptional regulator [Paenibacillus lutimineralis]
MGYKIGEFSIMNKISQRMLRYYDEKGLLTPKKDEANGYRYYSADDIQILNTIKKLRRYHFSIEDIKLMLESDGEVVNAFFQQKITELQEIAQGYANAIEEMKRAVEAEKTINRVQTYPVFQGTSPSFHAICFRETVNEDGLELFMDHLQQSVKQMNPVLCGQHFAIFHTVQEADTELYDVEICQPIDWKKGTDDSRIRFFRESPCISTLHRGSYDSISYAYRALHDWATAGGYPIQGPFIEIYHTDGWVISNEEAFVTEVCVSIGAK